MTNEPQFVSTSQCSQLLGTPSFRGLSNSSGSVLTRSSRTLQEKPAESQYPASEIHQEFILMVTWRGDKLGAAYYDTISHELYVVADVVENSSEVLRALFFQVKPQTLMVKTKLESERLAVINSLLGVDPSEAESTEQGNSCYDSSSLFSGPNQQDSFNKRPMNDRSSGPHCKLHFVPSVFFNLESAKRRLLELRLRGQPEDMSETEKMVYFKSIFPMNYPAVVQATGALLRVLETWKRGQDLERLMDVGNDQYSTVAAIHVHRLDDLVWMDQSAYLSLQIFSHELHPASAKAGLASCAKEGLSLFGITSRCFSTPGFIHLRNMETLRQRYRVIQFLKTPCNREIFISFSNCLRHVSNVKVSLASIAIMQGTITEWKKILTTTSNLIHLSSICKSLPQDIGLFHDLSRCQNTGHLHRISDIIHRLINFEESRRAGRCVINQGVDDDLDQLKQAYSNMPRIYIEAAGKEMKELPSNIDQATIEFLPQLGHCLCIRSWLPPGTPITPETVTIPGMEMKFFTSDNIYFKSKRCYEMDETYGDFVAEIAKHEMSLILSASNVILEISRSLLEAIELAGYLDALMSLTMLSLDFELVQPELLINEDGRSMVEIEKGRHILQELCMNNGTFNANSASLGVDRCQRIGIITGPNSSGKSVYLKVALIVYMAQIGCFVPAQRLRLSPVTHIFSICHTPESTAISLSQFGLELSAISVALREATSSSLVIIDEFGQGTSDIDGSALLISCMEYWISQSGQSPLILVATHLHNAADFLMKSDAVTSKAGSNVRFMSMAYTCQEDELIFLYEPTDNLCGNSFPFSVAQAAGVPKSIIDRGKEVFTIIENGHDLTPVTTLWNEAKSRRYRENMLKMFQLDSENVGEIKQFIKRNILVNWGSPSPN